MLGGIDASSVGILLLGTSVGSVLTAPIIGVVLERFSIRKVARVAICLMIFTLILLSIIATMQIFYGAVICCFFLGMFFSSFNVAANVSGVAIEKRANGRTLMPRFHSFFQIGAVCGTIFSQIIIFFNLHLIIQYFIIGLIAIITVFLKIKHVYRSAKIQKTADIVDEEVASGNFADKELYKSARKSNSKMKISKFRRKMNNGGLDRTILIIGFMVLASTLCEGSGNDWITQGIVEGFNVNESTGLIGMWIYLLTTASVRFFGVNLIDKFGRKNIMRCCFTLAFIGIVLYIFVPLLPIVIFGCLLWGAGVSLGYPIGISAASENHEKSAFRASVVATLGNSMNIAGPPLIGIFANMISIRFALIVLIPATILGFCCSKILAKTDRL